MLNQENKTKKIVVKNTVIRSCIYNDHSRISTHRFIIGNNRCHSKELWENLVTIDNDTVASEEHSTWRNATFCEDVNGKGGSQKSIHLSFFLDNIE